MLIDWFTIAAQAINFVVLVWLMKRFLYRPILRAVEAREKRIAASLAEADARLAEAQRQRDEFQAKNSAFDQQRSALMAQAVEAATGERRRLFEEARQAANALDARLQESLRADAGNLGQSLAEKARQEVFAIAKQTLSDLADSELDERAARVFIRRLREAKADELQRLAHALQPNEAPVLIRSAFELSEATRKDIGAALGALLSPNARVQFETAPALIGGIELLSNGQKVAWSISNYLEALEQNVVALLNQPTQTRANDEHGN